MQIKGRPRCPAPAAQIAPRWGVRGCWTMRRTLHSTFEIAYIVHVLAIFALLFVLYCKTLYWILLYNQYCSLLLLFSIISFNKNIEQEKVFTCSVLEIK